MHATIMNKTPSQWLLDQGLGTATATEITGTFAKGSHLEVLRYGAGSVFYRFHGRQAPRPIWGPNFWVLGEAFSRAFSRAGLFEGFLTDQEIARLAKLHYRELAAISYIWGQKPGTGEIIRSDMNDNELWKIELRGSESVEGLQGTIAPQPTHHKTQHESASSSLFKGGALQAYLNPRTLFVCTPINWG